MSLQGRRCVAWLTMVVGVALALSQLLVIYPFLPAFFAGLLLAGLALTWIVDDWGEGR